MKKILFLIILLMTSCATKGKTTIAGIVFQNDLFMRMAQIGMENAGKEHNVDVLLGNSDNQIDKEAKLIDTYIARGVKAIVLMPLSTEGSQAAIRRAKDAGIKVILLNTRVKNDSLYETFIATENSDLGKASGLAARQYIQENFPNEEVQVVTIAFKAQLPEPSEARLNGFISQINDLNNVKIVAQQDAWLAEQSLKVVGDIITANPNIKVIYSANDGGTIGAVQAVKNAGKVGQIAVFGTDGNDQIVQMLLSEDGILKFAAAQKPVDIGFLGIQVALSSLAGTVLEKFTSVPVLGLDSKDPEGVKEFQKELESFL